MRFLCITQAHKKNEPPRVRAGTNLFQSRVQWGTHAPPEILRRNHSQYEGCRSLVWSGILYLRDLSINLVIFYDPYSIAVRCYSKVSGCQHLSWNVQIRGGGGRGAAVNTWRSQGM